MKRKVTLVAIAAASCSACTFDGASSDLSECRPSDSVFQEMQRLHDDNESKVHELIKCGGVQTAMSRNFIVVLVASNRSLFDEQAYLDLVTFARGFGVDLQVPFHREPGGVWSLPINAVTDSNFTVTFHDTRTNAIILDDPFVIDSYLTGVTATSSLTIDQMKADLQARSTIRFSYTGLGPHSHELNGGQPIPNPFTIRISFADLAKFIWGWDLSNGEPDLGPLESVLNLNVDSYVTLRDAIGETSVEYDVAGIPGTLRETAANGVSFDVRSIRASRRSYFMDGQATDLRFAAGAGSLVGSFEYRVQGPGGDLLVTDTYDPAAGMTVTWSCPR